MRRKIFIMVICIILFAAGYVWGRNETAISDDYGNPCMTGGLNGETKQIQLDTNGKLQLSIQ